MANTQIRTKNEKRAETKHPVVAICLTQRAQRTQRFNSPTAHAGAGGVASFTATGERREGRNIWHCLCYKRIFYIFVESINENIV